MRLSISVARSNLVSLGTCFGKFSKSGKFKLHITALDYLAQYAKYKVHFHFILPVLSSDLLTLDMDKAQRGDALPIWQSCSKGTSRSHN